MSDAFIKESKYVILIAKKSLNPGIIMKILFMAPNVCMDCTTGDVTHVTELANNLVKLGNKVILVARLKKEKKKIFTFEFKNVGYTNNSKFWIPVVMIGAFVSGSYILLTKKTDVIYERHHVFGIGVLLGRIFGVPTIVEVNGITYEEMSVTGSFNPLFTRFARFIEQSTFKNADKIVAVTDGINKQITDECRLSTGKTATVLNGANVEIFKPIANSRDILKLNSKLKYIVFVGHLVEWQGIDNLIMAAKNIIESLPETQILIVGEGKMKSAWIQLAEQMNVIENFTFVGGIPYEQVPLYISASDVCVAPFIKSRKLSPLKLYEYMACGKPFVVSNMLGFECFEESNAGILVEPENVNELSDAIMKLLNNEELAEEMGLNGREHIIKSHGWRHVAKRIEVICKNTIHSK